MEAKETGNKTDIESVEKTENATKNNSGNNDTAIYLFLIFAAIIAVVVYSSEESFDYILGKLFAYFVIVPLVLGVVRLLIELFAWFWKGVLKGLVHGFHFDDNEKWRP